MTGIYANSIKDKTGTRELASDSGSAWGWGANVPVGTTLQTTMNTSDSPASGTGVVNAVSHSITMSSSSNKLLVFAVMSWGLSGGNNNTKFAGAQLVTSGSGVTAQTYRQTLTDATGSYGIKFGLNLDTASYANLLSTNYLFSPAYHGSVTVTASMVGYPSQHGSVSVNEAASANNSTSSIILMEVKA